MQARFENGLKGMAENGVSHAVRTIDAAHLAEALAALDEWRGHYDARCVKCPA